MTLEELSLQVFGTPDYEDMLAVLHPSDGLVRQFYKKQEEYK